MSTLARLGLVAAAALAAGCGFSPTEPTETFGGSATALSVDVAMPADKYTPNHIDIALGGVVRFVVAAVEHDVRFGGNTLAPSDILATSNATVTRTFLAKGTFAFYCTLHANMTGTVVVH